MRSYPYPTVENLTNHSREFVSTILILGLNNKPRRVWKLVHKKLVEYHLVNGLPSIILAMYYLK